MKSCLGPEPFAIKHKELFLKINFLKSIILPQKGLKDFNFTFFAALMLFVGASLFILFLNTPLVKLAFMLFMIAPLMKPLIQLLVMHFSVCCLFVISVISNSNMLVLIAFLMWTFVDLMDPVY